MNDHRRTTDANTAVAVAYGCIKEQSSGLCKVVSRHKSWIPNRSNSILFKHHQVSKTNMPPKEALQVPSFVSFTSGWHSAPYDQISPLRPELSATGRTVVVTGGGTGIGKAIAKAFVQAGASVVAILGRREDRLKEAVDEIAGSITATKPRLIFKVADLNKADQVRQAFKEIVEEGTGKIDILVPNAGDLVSPAKIVDTVVDDFMRGFDYNVRLPFNAIRAFLPYAADNAVVLNISSGVAHMRPVPGLSAHAASKAAGVKLLDSVQAENPGLHVVNIQPGAVATAMSQKAGAGGAAKDDRK